jgi:hypothetical protein
VLSVGHDEYWSPQMKANLSAYVSQGGNIAFFGANTCWWRINYDDDLTGFACNRDNTVTRPDADQWWVVARHEPGASPEDSLTGVSYRNAGGWWWPGRPQIPFEVQRPDHWVFEGGVDPEFGAAQSLMGYECDGAELTFGSGPPGEPAVPTFNGGTPAGFTVLAVGRLVDGFSFEKRDPDSLTAAVAPRMATMGVYTAAGTVFNAAVVDWARVLQDGESNVDRITRNVLARLGGNPAAPAASTTLPSTMGGGVPNPPIAVAALPPGSGPAGAGLAVVADGAGTIRSGRLDGGGAGSLLLGPQPDLRDVDAFVSEDDGLAHVLVALVDGTITDLSFTSTAAAPVVTSLELGNHPGVAAVSGFYSGDDEFRHAIVLTDDGTVTEIYFHPVHGIGTAELGTFPGAIDVASFFSSDDEFRHAIVLTDDGTVTEIYFHQVYGQGRAELATVAGARRVSAHRSVDDPHFDRRVVVTADDGRLHEIRFAARQPIVRSVIANPGPTVDVACVPGADHRCEVLLARPDGSVDIRAF